MDKIAVLDFGSQFAHLLANRVRRLGVYSELIDPESSVEVLKDYTGFIISGGPASVNDPHSPKIDPTIFELGRPILGICYGHQAIMHALGGTVSKGHIGEYGLTEFVVNESRGILKPLVPGAYQVYASHFDTVTQLPEGFESIGVTHGDANSATINESKKIYTLQFHPEVSHTESGLTMLDEFIKITGAKRDWSIEAFIQQEIEAITKKVGDKKVFLMISGGVDSTVAYVLLAEALGPERVYAMYVDTGLMRKNETGQIQRSLKSIGIDNVHTVQAGGEFFEALEGVVDPEEKRKIIGDKFIEIQRRVVKELNLNPEEWLFGQGTIYPDTIESGGTKNADKIKTHHNRVPEIEAMIQAGKVIEPISELYKDEVRMVGERLGLPHDMVHRHPFPGPGLGVRCLGSHGPEGPHKVVEWEGLTGHILPLKSVGVQGDERTYRHPLVLEETGDWEKLRYLAPKITNKWSEVNRVMIRLAADEPIERVDVLPTSITPGRIALLQEADALVFSDLSKCPDWEKVWQCPTVLLPLRVNDGGSESIVIRPVSSTEAMTANFTELPWDALYSVAKKLLELPQISAVFYDITNKPPGTIEWE